MKKEREPITVKEAAIRLRVSERTVRRMLKAGKLNAVQALYEGHRQSFILMDEKWKNQISKKQNDAQKVSETAFMRLCVISARNAEKSAKDYADKAAASCRGAAASSAYAREQANVAKNASADSNRYYNATKAYAADTLEHRKHAENAVISARHEADSAMNCVIWCAIGTVISICGAIISILK